tara:strand:- start:182 stop:523 length:342 start_codon:yes stop_codon:yes gene_type:complete
MKLKNFAILLIIAPIFLYSCSSSKKYDVSDLEQIGFKKETQQMFAAIGAIDGWSGILGGDKIEIYFYENANKVNKAFFEDEAAGQYWKDSCIKGNVGLISKGNNACKILESLK